MRRGELFDVTELRIPLTLDQKNSALRRIIDAARFGAQYTYTIKEACGILGISRDSMDFLIHTYRIDAIAIGTIYRIAWYSLAEYIVDPADDLDEVFDEYIRSRYKPN
jgi:excisionase family DNA binding protein